MIIPFTLLLSLFSCYGQEKVSVSSPSPLPGRAILWSSPSLSSLSSSLSSSPKYKTQSVTVNEIQKLLKENILKKEILVMFCSNSQTETGSENESENIKEKKISTEFISNSIFSTEISSSGDAIIFPNLYSVSDSKIMTTNICNQMLTMNSDTKIVTPEEITKLITNSDILSNDKLESYLVQVPSSFESDISSYKTLFNKLNSAKALFVALQNPSNQMPTQGNYHRLLSSDIEDGVNYLPEGSEFSIYYQAQYLYLTPDIFTGIMTGLFMAFVLLIGFNCMGSIQGNSVYPTVLPPLGKEG